MVGLYKIIQCEDGPYYTNDMPIEEVLALGRTEKDKIRPNLAEDLQQAQNLLFGSYSGDDVGRANKWANATA